MEAEEVGNGPIVTIDSNGDINLYEHSGSNKGSTSGDPSPEIAATSSQMKQPTLAVKKIVAAASPKPLVIAERARCYRKQCYNL